MFAPPAVGAHHDAPLSIRGVTDVIHRQCRTRDGQSANDVQPAVAADGGRCDPEAAT